jgi:hypothetical protein
LAPAVPIVLREVLEQGCWASPLDLQLSILCDEAAIETYHCPTFERIAGQVVEIARIRMQE